MAERALTVSTLPPISTGGVTLEIELAPGRTVAEIVAIALPELPESELPLVRVILAHQGREAVVPQAYWHRVRPHPGVRVIIRVPPAKKFLSLILQVIVLIVAVALAVVLGPMMAGTFGLSALQWGSIIMAGVSLVGNLLINALIPAPTGPEKEKDRFSITAMRNSANPDGMVPVPLGRLRYAPYYACMPYSEIIGDQQYIRALFVWGYGRLKISDLRLGDTSIDDYDEVEIETREGVEGDDPITLFPQQVIEEVFTVELTRAWQRNDAGNYLSGGHTIEKSYVRRTATDAAEACVILAFPGGLVRINDDGDRETVKVSLRIRQQLQGSSTWSEVTTLNISAATGEPFFRSHRWVLPSRGTWAIEITRMSDESKSSRVQSRCMWQALQSFRPEYPINFDAPLALTAIRIKATYQLQGSIDNLNGLVSRVLPDWDAETESWVERETRSPAAAYRFLFQGAASAYPVSDAEIDLEALQDWSEFCAAKGLHYDHVHDDRGSQWDAATAIAAAGRAAPRNDGSRWTVMIDRPSDIVADHINGRNSRGFKWLRNYAKFPDGFRVSFQDSSNDYKKGERIVPWPGHTGDVIVTEQLDLQGKTDPSEIWIEARRRQHEIMLRPDHYQVAQDTALCRVTRGDMVAVSADTLSRVQRAARVKRVIGKLIELDDDVTMEAEGEYAIRFRHYASDADQLGESIVRLVATEVGTVRAVTITGTGEMPVAGDIVHFGTAGSVDLLAFVRGLERGDKSSTILYLVDAAPEIDTLTDAEVPPAWDGRVGSVLGAVDAAPGVPSFAKVLFDSAASEITVYPLAGAGSAIIGSFVVSHRLHTVGGTGVWAAESCTQAGGAVVLSGYHVGQTIDLKVRAVSIYEVEGPDTSVVTYVVGEELKPVPGLLAFDVDYLASAAWRITFTIDTETEDTATVAGVRVRARGGSWTEWADLAEPIEGLLIVSPMLSDLPLSDGGIYTFGAVVEAADGRQSSPIIIETVGLALGNVVGIGGGDLLGAGGGRIISLGGV